MSENKLCTCRHELELHQYRWFPQWLRELFGLSTCTGVISADVSCRCDGYHQDEVKDPVLKTWLSGQFQQVKDCLLSSDAALREQAGKMKAENDQALALQKQHYEEQLSALRADLASCKDKAAKWDAWKTASSPAPASPTAGLTALDDIRHRITEKQAIPFGSLAALSESDNREATRLVQESGYACLRKLHKYIYRKPAVRKPKVKVKG